MVRTHARARARVNHGTSPERAHPRQALPAVTAGPNFGICGGANRNSNHGTAGRAELRNITIKYFRMPPKPTGP